MMIVCLQRYLLFLSFFASALMSYGFAEVYIKNSIEHSCKNDRVIEIYDSYYSCHYISTKDELIRAGLER